VERVPSLVEERLVVVQPALRARDQVDDARRVGGDHAGARRLLRPVLEIGPDAPLGLEVEAERCERRETDGHAPLLRVRRLERRKAPDPRHVRARGGLLTVRAEQAVEPPLPLRCERRRALDPRSVDRVENRAERDALLGLVACDGVGDPRHVGVELVPGGEERAALVVEGRRHLEHGGAEGVAVGIGGLDSEPRLGGAERKLVVAPGNAGGEERVLERILALGQLAVGDSLLASEAQAGDLLAAVAARRSFGPGQRLELLAGEEVRVARDDRCLLGGLLLPHAYRPRLLRALLEVRIEPLLEWLRVECAHAATSAPRRRRASDVSRPNSSSDS